jgi:hypothetical protein
MFARLLVVLKSLMFCIVLVFYSVVGPCIRFAVKSVEMAKMHITTLEVHLIAQDLRSCTTMIERTGHDRAHSTSVVIPTLP